MGSIGTEVLISGSNLDGATRVTFGGVAATEFSAPFSLFIEATVPVGAVSGPITVTTPRGTTTSTQSFMVTGTGVPRGFEELPVRVFSSPATSLITIEATLKTASPVSLHLSNAAGVPLMQQGSTAGAGAYRTTMDMSTLPSGVYFLRVQAGGAAWVEKIVKQ
jgi:hypothetical protein